MVEPIKIVINGALGKMGRETSRAILHEPELKLVGAVGKTVTQKYLPLPEATEPVPFSANLDSLLETCRPDVLVDFTNAAVSIAAARIAIKKKVNIVIGTTGLSEENLKEIDQLCRNYEVGAIEAANFSLGATLLKHFASIAARFFDYAEIIETADKNKLDAPSATSIATAKAMIQARGKPFVHPEAKMEIITNTRGGQIEGVAIHSLRLPVFVKSGHEAIFSGAGQTLSLRHEELGRESFMPGVILAIKEVINHKGLISGWSPWKF
ncbi:4-hydroxy-tetrahydrodipicolinate reductase [Chloroflexota bacterium]